MTSPVLELTGAIVARLKSYATLTELVGGRVYDNVPAAASFPYVSLGPTDEIADNTDCFDASEVTVQIDVWSRAVGAPESLRIAEAIKQALKADMTLTDNALALFEHRNTRRFRDPDGLTSHSAIEFAAIIETH